MVSCSSYSTLREFFTNGEFIAGWNCAMTGGDPAAELAFASVIFSAVGMGLFVTTGSFVTPSILAILFGGVILSLLPATFTNLALVGVLVLLGALGLLIAFRSGS